MYQIIQMNMIREEVQFCNPNGEVVFTVPVTINVDEKACRFEQAYERIGLAQLKIKKEGNSEADLAAYGKTILDFFAEIFGTENTQKILEFYKDNYTEMVADIIGFVENEIKPKVAAAQEAKKQKLLAVKKSERWRR